MANKYYAVKAGRNTGIYETWDACREQVDGYAGCAYKSFQSLDEAYEYMGYTSSGGEESAPVSGQDEMVAYVDGSYNNATKEFSYGMIAFLGGETIRDCKAFDDENLASMRNVAGEIKGSEAAMRLAIARKCRTLHIYHDYEGIAKWPLGEWKANKEGTIAYKEFYESIKPELTVVFHKVTGHSGDKYNDEADSLAKSALSLR
ncbi:MAG: RNase H [Lachnospiraceae bacterium]|nr:RNase H [Lachnospiraceae bacterium]